MTDSELERIRKAYRARDAVAETPYRWDNPGYIFYVQGVERALLRALVDIGLPLEGARILDVGCGSGYFLHRLAEYGAAEAHGIDLVEGRVTAGLERYPTLALRVGSATDLPYADGAFDLVTQFTCLSSMLDDDVRLTAAREMRRVAEGGWVLSFDVRGLRLHIPDRRRAAATAPTPTAPLDRHELTRLFGEPVLLRREALAFEIAQLTGRHATLSAALAALPPLRSHLLGVWQVPG